MSRKGPKKGPGQLGHCHLAHAKSRLPEYRGVAARLSQVPRRRKVLSLPMLQVVFSRVKVDQVDRLRSWMAELMARPHEVRQTFEQEGVRHEMAFLVEAREGPLLVYAIEVEGDNRTR